MLTVSSVRREAKSLAVDSRGSGVPFVWGHTLLGSMAQEDATGVFGWRELPDARLSVANDRKEPFRWTDQVRDFLLALEQ